MHGIDTIKKIWLFTVVYDSVHVVGVIKILPSFICLLVSLLYYMSTHMHMTFA